MTRAPLDAFSLLARQFAGKPVPKPPRVRGWLIARRDDMFGGFDLKAMEPWQVADFVGIPMKAARLRIAIANETGDFTKLLAPIERPAATRKPKSSTAAQAADTTPDGDNQTDVMSVQPSQEGELNEC